MELKEGAAVFTAGGDKVGEIDKVVIDPKTKEATHLVVKKGFLFTKDKVVPMSLVGPATEGRVTLREAAGDLEGLPDFQETHYFPSETQVTVGRQYPPGYVRPIYYYPPRGFTYWRTPGYPQYGPPQYVSRTVVNIPEGTVPLDEGAKVISSDDKHVGDVEEIPTDPQENRASHLVIGQGLLFKQHKLVPTRWVANVTEDEVHLAVSSDFLEGLPDYESTGG